MTQLWCMNFIISPQENRLWGDMHETEESTWHLVFLWDFVTSNLIWQSIISRSKVVVAAELGSGSGNCPFSFCCVQLHALDIVHVLGAVPPGSLIPYFPLAHWIPAPSRDKRTHSYLLKPPEQWAWQRCHLSAVAAGGRHSPLPGDH